MGWLPIRVLAPAIFATALLAQAAPAHAEKRVALVIGNNGYRSVPKLQKAVNDARTMGDTLKQLGFAVMEAENQTRQAFSQTLLAFDATALAASGRAAAQTKPQTPSLREAGGNPLWAVPVTALSATRERPLFQASRRPLRPPAVAATVVEIFKPPSSPAEPDRPGLALIGAVVSETEGIAVFVDEVTRNIVRLKMGEDHTGWFLRSVKKREVLLQKADEAVTLVLAVPSDHQRAVLPGLLPPTGGPVLPGLTRASPLATGGPPPGLPAAIAPPVTGRLPGL
jgi:Caspase domain